MLENQKIQSGENESGSDAALALELVGVGSYDSAATILERFLSENEPNETSALVSLALLFRSPLIEAHLSGSECAGVGESRFTTVSQNTSKILSCVSLLGAEERAFFVGEFLGDYLSRLIADKTIADGELLAFVHALGDLIGEMKLSFTKYGCVFGERFPLLEENDADAALWQIIINRLYQLDKSAYALEEQCRGRSYLKLGRFDEARDSLENALTHLSVSYECRFLLLCVALGVKDEAEFLLSENFSMDMPEYINLLVSLKGHSKQMAKYTALAEKNLKTRGLKAPEDAPKVENTSRFPWRPVLIALAAVIFCAVLALLMGDLFCGSDGGSGGETPPSPVLPYEENVSYNGYEFTLNHSFGGYVFTGISYNCLEDGILDLLNVHLSLPIVGIADEAMIENTEIRGTQLPDTITFVGERAFAGCTELEGFDFGYRLREIGVSAFEGCTSLKYELDYSMYIKQAQLERIGASAFRGTAFEEICLPDSLVVIEAYAFADCTRLDEIRFGADSKLTELHQGAFANTTPSCLFLPKGIKQYNENTLFKEGHQIEEVYFCGTIEEAASCQFLKVEGSVYYSLIYYYDKNQTESAPAHYWTYIGTDYGLGSWTKDLSYTLSEDESYYIVSGIGSYESTDVIIPSYYRNKPVQEIGDSALQRHYVEDSNGIGGHAGMLIQSISIPETVTRIGDSAFLWQSELKEVIFEGVSQLSYIGEQAFDECSSLVSISLPMHVTQIRRYTFAGCTSLESIEIQCDYGFKIGPYAFTGCTSLSRFDTPEYTSEIGVGAFSGCSSLQSIFIPDTVITLSDYAFLGCDALTIYFEKPESFEDFYSANYNPSHRPVVWNSSRESQQ